ncbi:MAG: RNA-binding protein [Patescibacteria group bacterium]
MMTRYDSDERPEAAPNKKLFVAGLDWNATDDDLRQAFEKYGEITEAAIVRFSDTGKSKGFGFVEFTDVEAATKAKEEMDGAMILSRAVRVNYAFPKREEARA